jgi:virginiamycin B lyase
VPVDVALGGDGAVWFTDQRAGHPALGSISVDGRIREFRSGLAADSSPFAISRGADGAMWFTDDGAVAAIGRVSSTGRIAEFTNGIASDHVLGGIALGFDGAMWFTDSAHAIGQVSRAGRIREYSSGLRSGSSPAAIARGPDGAMWFADQGCVVVHGYCGIGRITRAGSIKEFAALPSNEPPFDLALGSDGNMWFTSHRLIGRITRGGKMTLFQVEGFTRGVLLGGDPTSLAAGPGGWMWVDDSACLPGGGSLNIQVCAVGRFRPGAAGSRRLTVQWFHRGFGKRWRPVGLVEGADRNMWFTALGVRRSVLGRIGAG